MITAVHTVVFASEPDRAREFFRDVLGLSGVDAHDGWLIFTLPPAELAVHPASGDGDGDGAGSGRHELYLMCDDIAATMSDLTARGAEFTMPVRQASFGLLTSIRVPGAGDIGLYEPRHRTAYAD
jgi:catechol 2,3-dioxygenase-like lactoylglutathione lyase family enzyme